MDTMKERVTAYVTDGTQFLLRVAGTPDPQFLMPGPNHSVVYAPEVVLDVVRVVDERELPEDFLRVMRQYAHEWAAIEQMLDIKASALRLLEPLGFEDLGDAESPAALWHSASGFVFDSRQGPADVIRAAVQFGREQGREEVRSEIRKALGIGASL